MNAHRTPPTGASAHTRVSLAMSGHARGPLDDSDDEDREDDRRDRRRERPDDERRWRHDSNDDSEYERRSRSAEHRGGHRDEGRDERRSEHSDSRRDARREDRRRHDDRYDDRRSSGQRRERSLSPRTDRRDGSRSPRDRRCESTPPARRSPRVRQPEELTTFRFLNYYHEPKDGVSRKQCHVPFAPDPEYPEIVCVKNLTDSLMRHVKESLGLGEKMKVRLLIFIGVVEPEPLDVSCAEVRKVDNPTELYSVVLWLRSKKFELQAADNEVTACVMELPGKRSGIASDRATT